MAERIAPVDQHTRTVWPRASTVLSFGFPIPNVSSWPRQSLISAIFSSPERPRFYQSPYRLCSEERILHWASAEVTSRSRLSSSTSHFQIGSLIWFLTILFIYNFKKYVHSGFFQPLCCIFAIWYIHLFLEIKKKKLFQHLFNGKSSEESLDMPAGSAYLCEVALQGEGTCWVLCELWVCVVCSRGRTHPWKSGPGLCN